MISLKKIRLINWYGFSNITVPIGVFTLIAGKNGNGKSVLLDAIKYALYGDTVFNKSTENKGSRTISSYTRGLLDATAGSYMRPADKNPNIYTHIVLEMEEEDLNKKFILGTVIETGASNSISTQRYVIEDKSIDEVEHTYRDGDSTFVYSGAEIQKKYGLKMMQVGEGLSKFMQRTGLRLNEQQLAAFRRKLRSIMSYDPNAKIDQFIRECVLEEKKVDFSKLVETKGNIDSLTKTFESIDAEIKELENIITLFDSLNRARNVVLADDVKISYRSFLTFKEQLERAIRNIEAANRQIERDELQLTTILEKEKETRILWNSSKDHLNSMDCAKAISEAREALDDAEKRKEELSLQKKNLISFQTRISELIEWLAGENQEIYEKDVLSSLTVDMFSSSEKESAVINFSSQLKKYKDEIIGEMALISKELESNLVEQNSCDKAIEDFNAKKTTFSEIPDYVALKKEINREFERRGIKSEARFACEYVIGLKDESWRDVIEGYLGRRRYTILVEPEYYDIADDILNQSKNRYAHLFNTKLLMKKEIRAEEDSVMQFIDVKNTVAKKYFDYQLGRFHATSTSQVREFENAMSKEGRVAVAMDSYFIRFNSIRFYCLGQETLKLNKRKMQKRLEALKKQENLRREEIALLQSKKSYLNTEIELFGDYNYDAVVEFDEAVVSSDKKKAELNALIEAQKNNMEYMQLAQRVSELEKELEAISREMEKVRDDKSKQNTEIRINANKRDEATKKIDELEKNLKEYELRNTVIYRKAIEDYDNYLAAGRTGAGGILKDRERSERALREASTNLMKGQAAYNAARTDINRLPLNEHSVSQYQNRKNKIWLDDCQEIQAKLKEQTRRYEEIFKNEFVLTVLKSCEAARSDLKLINAELSRLSFKSVYEFDVKYVRDGSDYEKILEYARYLKEREELGTKDNQLIFDSMSSVSNEKAAELDKEIKKIINRIVDSNDKEKIENYADYRNYMTYEILLTNDVLSKAKLSKQSGYNSGAEVQIPYMLILLSALLMIYNDKFNSSRLVFIDEPFAKMDPTNVKIMLNFMKEQKLQMIFCAPDKTELIGNECEVILPVLRTKADLMEIGTIEMHKGA